MEQTNFLAKGKKVYIIGDVGIGEELDLLNIPHFGGPADSNKVIKLGPGLLLLYLLLVNIINVL